MQMTAIIHQITKSSEMSNYICIYYKQVNFHLKQIENLNPFGKDLFFGFVFTESAECLVIWNFRVYGKC